MTLDVEIDRLNTYSNNNRARDEILNIMDQYCMKDVWRIQNIDRKEYSWRKKGSTPTKASRIDFALVSGGLDQNILCPMYITSTMTDHRAFYMVVETNPYERGKGYWKMNNSLLSNPEYIEAINKEIDTTTTLCHSKPFIEQWETLKQRIKKTTVKFARRNAAEEKIVISQLSEKIDYYESKLPLNREEDSILENTKAELDDKMLHRAQGLIFRSKAKWYEQGEKNTKYFYSLEKAKYNAKTCFKLLTDSGTQIQDPQEILVEQRAFYASLYEEDENVKFTLENTYGIKVPEKIKRDQENQLTLVDLQEAIRSMKNNRTPGEDGIPVDFYKVFWSKIKDIFYGMVLEVYNKNVLHKSARKGILNLIPKPNKDTRLIKNLRPITLLNTDYKIIEKAIANKMIPALEHIINKDQRGFMKDRRISVNIRKMLDIIQQCKVEDLEAVVLSLDFVKYFDKCSFSILHGSLDFFDFGSYVKTWTKILYHDFSVRIQNNGHFSSPIDIKKGVHQGGCCSSVYFLVIAEILALALRSNQNIKGITIKDIKNLLNQFADDMDIFSENDESSLKKILEELDRFKLQSGFTVSYDKTTLYRIGSLRHSNAQLYGIDEITWSNEDIQVLGVTISHEDIIQKNYTGLVQKARETLNLWYNRGLSLFGKVQVVNTLVASLFVYKMMVLPQIPPTIVKTLENIIREFLWNKKKAKISMKILQNPKDHGGLNLVNLSIKDKALKATWPMILNNEEEYAQMVYRIMRCSSLQQNIWRCSIQPKDVKKLGIKEDFWIDVLSSWSEYNVYKNTRTENQLLWYNSKIRIKDKPFFWSDAYNKGLLYVHQLFIDEHYKSYELIKQQYGLTKLRYNSLKAALPKEWKVFFEENPAGTYLPLPPHNYDYCVNHKIKNLSQEVYKFLQDDVLLTHNKYLKWIQDLGSDFCEGIIDFGRLHIDMYKLTNVPKYRSFQYRLLQRALVTNNDLYKWGIVSSPTCYFCNNDKETILHMMCKCPIVRALWNDVKILIENTLHISICLSDTNIILNKLTSPKNHVVNFICLVVKQYIYRQKCLKENLNIQNVKMLLQKIQNMERYIAIKNGHLQKHLKKWHPRDENVSQNSSLEDFLCEYMDRENDS